MLRLSAFALLACALGCQAIAGIEQKRPTVEVDLELCRDYCKAVGENCTDDYQVYRDEAQCMSACKKLPAKGSGNSVECRYGVVSPLFEKIDCAGAGPGGATRDDLCGSNCENYCWLMSQACSAEELYRSFWLGDLDRCNAACKGIRDRSKDKVDTSPDSDSLYSARNDDAEDHTGDTIQCRLFHAVAATAPQGDIGHCWHAALSPHARGDSSKDNPCLDGPDQQEPRCSDYCRLVTVACTGDRKVYEDETQCLAGCEMAFPNKGKMEDDRFSDTTTDADTLACRYAHAYNALVAGSAALKKTHCGHASPSGGGRCGTPCEAYCNQLSTTCQDEAKGGVEQCVNQCETSLDPASVTSYSVELAKSGNTLACRLHALTEARASTGARKAEKCAVAAGKSACK